MKPFVLNGLKSETKNEKDDYKISHLLKILHRTLLRGRRPFQIKEF